MKTYAFEQLHVWQEARSLNQIIYRVTSALPDDERFGIQSQMRRACVSVCSNIAEGTTRLSNKEKGRFYEMAFGSLIELLNQLILCYDLKWITDKQYSDTRVHIDRTGRLLNALHMSTRRKHEKKLPDQTH